MPPTRRSARTRTAAAGLALLTTCSALAPPAWAQVRLPALGEAASQDLSVGAERRVGEQIMREGRRDPSYLDDPVLVEYLQSLWAPLVAGARQLGHIDAELDRAFAWEAFLVRDRSVNAFALPGGYVGVHLGLIALTASSDQLASVMAHELTHVSQRHIARSIAPQQQASLVAMATLLLGIIAASRSNNVDVANAAIMGGQGAALQGQLNFSRDMEREADRVGYSVLGAAGFSTAGMAGMFERMDHAARLVDNNSYPYLRTHPLTVDRIAEARNRTLVAGVVAPPPTLQHVLMQARARVLMDDSAQGLQRLKGVSASPLAVDQIGALYAGAMAASLLKDHARAETLLAEARQRVQDMVPRERTAERSLRLLQAELRLARGDGAAALQVLDELDAGPHERPPLLLRAQAVLQVQRSAGGGVADAALRNSTEALQTWVAEHAQDATAWALLGDCADALGLRLRALRAHAEARAALGDLGGAVDRLRAAQQASRGASGTDFIEASVIDARLRQISAQRRELALEARGERGGGRGGPDDGPPR